MVVRCLSIAQRTPVWEREPWFVPQVWSCGRTMLKSWLRWSVTWYRRAAFCRRRLVDCWVLAEGIDCFLIATSDHVDSSGFVVWISLRTNPDNRLIIDGVPIDGHVWPWIRFVVWVEISGDVEWEIWVEFFFWGEHLDAYLIQNVSKVQKKKKWSAHCFIVKERIWWGEYAAIIFLRDLLLYFAGRKFFQKLELMWQKDPIPLSTCSAITYDLV
jgi:hypothetical protein